MATKKFESVKQVTWREVDGFVRNGDLFFAAGDYPVSGLIKKLSDSVISHAGVFWKWGNYTMVLESVDTYGVRTVPLFNYFNNYYGSHAAYKGKIYIGRHHGLPQDPTTLQAMHQVALDLFGFSYDRQDEFQVLLSRINKKIKRKEDDMFLCSEYVEILFRCVGIQFKTDDHAGFIFPENIAADPQVEILAEIVGEKH